jgi:hypothetical protein
MFMVAILFTKTPWPILSDEMSLIVQGDWTQAIKAQDCQRALVGAAVSTPWLWRLASSPAFKIDLHR